MAKAITAICYLLAHHVPSVTELTSTREGTQHSGHIVTETSVEIQGEGWEGSEIGFISVHPTSV